MPSEHPHATNDSVVNAGPKAAFIGTAKREYDPVRYSQHNKVLVEKGIMY